MVNSQRLPYSMRRVPRFRVDVSSIILSGLHSSRLRSLHRRFLHGALHLLDRHCELLRLLLLLGYRRLHLFSAALIVTDRKYRQYESFITQKRKVEALVMEWGGGWQQI